jgi:hypothetical protein
MKYLVVTKGLSVVEEAKDYEELLKKVNVLKKMGYKRPMVFHYASQLSKMAFGDTNNIKECLKVFPGCL